MSGARRRDQCYWPSVLIAFIGWIAGMPATLATVKKISYVQLRMQNLNSKDLDF